MEIFTYPLHQSIGAPSVPVVDVGDEVKRGQMIAEEPIGKLGCPMYASVTGRVTAVTAEAITIEADGVPETMADMPYVKLAPGAPLDMIRAAGLVGLGGAGFPVAVKYAKPLGPTGTVIMNAAECEPYITSDTRTMLDRTDEIFEGIALLKKYLKVNRYIIGVEANKPEAIKKAQELAAKTEGVEVHVLPSVYPQGGEKVLVYNTLGRLIPKGGLPLDVGVVVINVTTLAFIARYVKTGMPLVEKCLTVDGSAVKEPKNVIAPIGTPISDVLEAAGGCKGAPAKVLYGGPMMGIAVPDLSAPILKNTNAIIAMDEKEARPPKTTPCINCGACLTHCPLKLDPREIARAYKKNEPEDLKTLCVDLCMECGCCSYVCPAKRHLVQTNKLAKAVLRDYLNKQKAEKEGAK